MDEELKTIQKDLKSNNLSLNEAIDVAQNRLLGRLMSTFGTPSGAGACPKKTERKRFILRSRCWSVAQTRGAEFYHQRRK